MYPELEDPGFGSFVASLNQGLNTFTQCEVDVLRREDGARGLGSYVSMTARGIRQSITDRNFDLVHGHYVGAAAGVAWTMAQVLRVPLVLTAHGSDVEAAQAPATRFIQRQLFERCGGLHFVSESLRQRAQDLLGSWDAPTLVVPTGIAMGVFSPLGEQYSSSTGRKRILMVGQTVVHKGWQDGIKALALLRQSGTDAELVALGGPRIEWLKDLAREHGVEQSFISEGQVSHDALAAYYRGADVVLVASHREGFGLVALEAMACGTPVVSTAVGGMKSYTEHGVNALVATVHDPESIAEQLKVALTDSEGCAPLVAKGLETASKFSVEEAAKKVSAFYETVLSTKSET